MASAANCNVESAQSCCTDGSAKWQLRDASVGLPYLSESPQGIELRILVQPRASRSRIVGEHDGQLKIQLAAPPVEGEANDALVALLCKMLGVPRGAVSIVSGDTHRRKRVRVTGVAADRVEAVMKEHS